MVLRQVNKYPNLQFYEIGNYPSFITKIVTYKNLNSDPRTQEIIIKKYLQKTIKWISNDPDFNKSKKHLSKLNGKDGYYIIHKILKLFIKKRNIDWIDISLRPELIKKYICRILI